MALPNEPITRQEMYLSNIAGQNTALPDAPITREEMYLDYIAKTGGTGEGDMKKSIYDSDTAVATAGGIKMFVNQKIGTLPQRVGSLETTAGVLQGEVVSIENTLGGLGTASTKNSTSVVTQSTDLVESGAVYDALGFGNKNLAKLYNWTGTNYNLTFTYSLNKVVLNGGNTNSTTIPTSSGVPEDGKFLLKAGTYTIWTDNANVDGEVVAYDPIEIVGSGNPATFTLSSDRIVYIRAVAKAGATFSNTEVHIQLEKGSTATAYEPYYTPLKDVVPQKCDNSVIGTVEDGATASQAYAVGSHFIRNGAFCTVTSAISANESLVESSKFTSGDVADAVNNVRVVSITPTTVGDVSVNYPTGFDIDNTVVVSIGKYSQNGYRYGDGTYSDNYPRDFVRLESTGITLSCLSSEFVNVEHKIVIMRLF